MNNFKITLMFVIFLLVILSKVGYAVDQEQIEQNEQIIRNQELQQSIDNQNIEKKEKIQEIHNIQNKQNKSPIYQQPKLSQTKSNKCFQINTIQIEASPIFDQEEELQEKYTNQCLSIVEINNMLAKITQTLLDEGYITSKAALKVGTSLKDKKLNIFILEGKINKINIKSEQEQGFFKKSATFPYFEDDVLNLREVEQAIERINELNSQQAKMAIKASSKSGYSDIDITVQDKLNDNYASLTTSNTGNESTGKNPQTLTLYSEDILGLNNKLTINYKHSEKQSEYENKNFSENINLSYKSPFVWWMIYFNFNKSKYSQENKGRIEIFTTSGFSQTWSLEIGRILTRGKVDKLSLAAQIERYENESYIDDALIEVSSRKMSNIKIKLDYLYYFNFGYLSVGGLYQQGITLSSDTQEQENLTDTSARIKYKLYKINSLFNANLFNKPIKYQWDISIQKSGSELYGTQQCSLGGYSSIRGFKNSLSEENCLISKHSLSSNLFKWMGFNSKYLTALSFGFIYDYGLVQSHDIPVRHTFSSFGYVLDYDIGWFNLSYVQAKVSEVPEIFDNKTLYLEDDNEDSYLTMTLKYEF